MKYLVWFSEVMGVGNIRSSKALEFFGTPQNIYNATYNERLSSGVFTKAELSRLDKIALRKATDIMTDCLKSEIDIIGINDKRYPTALSAIENPPLVLYVKGEFPDFNNTPSLAVVGPRKVSEFGKKAAYSLSFRLARAGFIVVSGGALGCDTYAHAGALKSGGTTVLVMGCGINAEYLMKNKPLRDEVASRGCLISELPPKAPVTKYAFPIRNRIISALTLGTVLVEAPEISGALITARLANEQGRDVFVIPGAPDKEEYKGSNALLRDGAKALLDLSDIFTEYIVRFPDKIDIKKAYDTKIIDNKPKKDTKPVEETKIISKKFNVGLSKEAKIVYNCIDKQKFLPEEILNTGLDSSSLLSALTELEMEFMIKAVPGGMYELCE
ncbi:MAG: DNA-processing protein DprA [Clostridia bacterium]|nr:DNA-processing protein DprA [Clostridia bacterium]